MGKLTASVWPRLLLIALVVALGLQQWRSGGQDGPDELRIGVIAHLSGPLSYNGASVVAAVELAAGEINAAGGVQVGARQIPLRLLIRDDRGEPRSAVNVARELIFHEEVHALIGPNASRNAIPVGALAEQVGMLMISPTSTHPATTAGRATVFRVSPLDTQQSHGLAQFTHETLGMERAAVIYDVASIYNRALAQNFKQEFEAAGGQVVAFESYTTGASEFATLAATVAAARPEVVLLPNYPTEVEAQAIALRAAGYDGLLLGSDSWGSIEPRLWPGLEGAYYTSHFGRDGARVPTARFVRDYVARYGSEPADAAALAYDALSLLVAVVEQSDSVESEVLSRRLRSFGPFEGVTGPIQYRQSGDPERGVSVMTFQGNQIDFVTYLRPAERTGLTN